jgi:iron complex outermembrane receptor protein
MITTIHWAFVRKTIAAFGVIAFVAGVLGSPAQARAGRLDDERRFDIPAQSLATALVQFSRQAEIQLVTSSLELASRDTAGVSGRVSIRRALESLLDRTGLAYSLVGENTIAIGVAGNQSGSNASTLSDNDPTAQRGSSVDIGRFAKLLAQADPTSDAQTSADTAASKHFDIKAKPLAQALMDFGVQSGLTVAAPTTLTAGKKGISVRGDLSPTEALERLLKGSGLTFARAADGTIAIQAISSSDPVQASAGESRLEKDLTVGSSVEEIVVTAQKKSERLQDTPVPVTVVDADALVNSNQLRLQDYYTRIPGLNVAYDGIRGGLPTLAIRGIMTSPSDNPTVGVVVDDVSYGSSTSIGGGSWVPDIDPSELQRVEVLRGPQGALYGAASMGGLLKYVTVSPSTTDSSGRVQAGMSDVKNGDGVGYNVRASANVPLSDTWAVRMSGFTGSNPGYVDDPVIGAKGVNSSDSRGGRIATLWRPTDAFSLKLSALFQKSTVDGSSHVHPALGDLQQNDTRNTGWLDRRIQAYDATINAKAGPAEIVSVSGYSINDVSDSIDFGSFGSPSAFDEANKSKKFTQEVRVSLPLSQSLQWMLGGFYADEDSHLTQAYATIAGSTGARTGVLATYVNPTTFRELAGFTNLTWTLTDSFDVLLGGRFSDNKKVAETSVISSGGTSGLKADATESKFTYLVTPRLRLSPDLMVYARLASGFRAGGINLQSVTNPSLPRDYKSDETRNYEIGLKGEFLERKLFIDASLYRIDWKDIQLALAASSGEGYIDNGGQARSQGVELSMQLRPRTGLSITGWVALNDGKLIEDFPATSTVLGRDGDRLPFSSRTSGNVSIDQEFPMANGFDALLGAAFSYVGERRGSFTGTGQRESYPSYTKLDLRAALNRGDWSANLFVNNVADKRGVLSGGIGTVFPFAYSYIQPRTVGFSLAKEF